MTMALEGGEGSASRPGRFLPPYPRERPDTHCAGGWVGPRTGLDRCGKSRPHQGSIPVPSCYTNCATQPVECTMCLTIIIYQWYLCLICKTEQMRNYVLTLWNQNWVPIALQKTKDLNGHPLLCMFLADNFSRCSFISLSHWTSTPSTRRFKLRKDVTFVILSVYRIYV
jgi:hypothetical protein